MGGVATGIGVGSKGALEDVEGRGDAAALALALFNEFLALSTYRGPIFHLLLFNSISLSQYLPCQNHDIANIIKLMDT